MKNSKMIVAATVAVSAMLGIGAASAADLPMKAMPYAAPALVFNWTGCYVGLHAGAGVYHSDFVSDGEGGSIGEVAGVQAGCNYQMRQLVVGIEGEAFWANLRSRDHFIFPGSNENFNTAKNTFDGTLAFRMGYAFDRLLMYGKVGAAWGRFEWARSETDQPGVGCECTNASFAQKTLPGLLLGAGFEYAFLDNWTAKLEYNYINFGNAEVKFTATCTGATCGPNQLLGSTDTEREFKHIVKVGVNYKFGGDGAVIARY